MSRSYKLKSPRTVDLPGGLLRSLARELGLPPERRRITVGRDRLDRWTTSIARSDFCAALRRRGWPTHAADAAAIRLGRYWSDEPDRDGLLISRRAFRRTNRQRMAAHRYEELGFFPHRELTLWD
jgi:hypothetical protein